MMVVAIGFDRGGWRGFGQAIQSANHKRKVRSNVKSTARARTLRVAFWSLFVILSFEFLSSGCDPLAHPKEIWLETGTGPGQIVYPRAIAYSPHDDTFFIVDRTAHVQHLDRNGKFLNEWHMPESQQGKPVGLSVGPDGNLYVPDTHYSPRARLHAGRRSCRELGSKGTGAGRVHLPDRLAFDANGTCSSASTGTTTASRSSTREGKFRYQFGTFGDGDGEFSRPQSIVIDGDHRLRHRRVQPPARRVQDRRHVRAQHGRRRARISASSVSRTAWTWTATAT